MPTVADIQEKARRKFDIKSAGERLLWRFKSGKAFVPNEADVDALTCVLSWINRQTSNNVNQHQLFAKLYIYHLTMNIRHYQTTVLDDYPVSDLHRTLSRPLELFYKAFFCDLHDNQLNKLLKSSKEDAPEVIAEYQRLKETFTEEYVFSKLNDQIGNVINNYS